MPNTPIATIEQLQWADVKATEYRNILFYTDTKELRMLTRPFNNIPILYRVLHMV
jgi:hypothetical protein